MHKSDQFVYVAQKISYNEPDNVTCSECGWAVHTPWHYLHQVDPRTPPPPPPAPPPRAHNLTQVCAAECCRQAGCVGFLFEAHSDVSNSACAQGGPCCWFKAHLHASAKKPASVGATIYSVDRKGGACSTSVACTDCDSPGQDSGPPINPATGPAPPPADDSDKVPPPMGIRSSPALGGVSTGSTELRSDGSFREWTIFNQVCSAGRGSHSVPRAGMHAAEPSHCACDRVRPGRGSTAWSTTCGWRQGSAHPPRCFARILRPMVAPQLWTR